MSEPTKVPDRSFIRITCKAPQPTAKLDDGSRVFIPTGREAQVLLVHPDGSQVNLTKELPVISASWKVDGRTGQSTCALVINNVEIDVDAELNAFDSLKEQVEYWKRRAHDAEAQIDKKPSLTDAPFKAVP